jgi:hypothetical protein
MFMDVFMDVFMYVFMEARVYVYGRGTRPCMRPSVARHSSARGPGSARAAAIAMPAPVAYGCSAMARASNAVV